MHVEDVLYVLHVSHVCCAKVTNDSEASALGECGITHELLEVGERAVNLPCGHMYKEEAIKQWLARADTCPTCRRKLS